MKIVIAVIVTMLSACVAEDSTSTAEQDNCTSPPVAPTSAGQRPVRAHTECPPANTAAQDALYRAQVAAASIGLTLPDNINIQCANGFCEIFWNFDPSLVWWIHTRCSRWDGSCSGGLCTTGPDGVEACN